jgi:hypothetical protein
MELDPENDHYLLKYSQLNEVLNPQVQQISPLDHRRISGEYHQLRHITFSQFDAMLKDILPNLLKRERLEFISFIFKLVQSYCVKYRLDMKKSFEIVFNSQLSSWMSVFNRKKNTNACVDQMIKTYLEQEDDDEFPDDEQDGKTRKFEFYQQQIMIDLKDKLEKYQLKDSGNFKFALISIFIDMCWIEMRMFYASGEYYEIPEGKFDEKEVESYEDCESKNKSIFTIFPGYQSKDQCYLKPIVYSE